MKKNFLLAAGLLSLFIPLTVFAANFPQSPRTYLSEPEEAPYGKKKLKIAVSRYHIGRPPQF